MAFLSCEGTTGLPCSWTEILLSTPLAADFEPGPEAAAEGVQLDGEFAVRASRRRFRAWPGGGGGGVRG